ncbi:hypothetical protein ACMA1D_25275 [Streptomyces sp. 796.1]|uniref:hypothetical protein n=1 Tax=Streptomyces sp. 796.1 TaxID=3163029 RepID=UPI0039C8EDAB
MTGQAQPIRREVRIFGALYCAVLAAVSLAWIIRDLDHVDESSDLWWHWGGLRFVVDTGLEGVPGSSTLDLLLIILYVVVGVTALNSAVAGSALVTVAVTTAVLRLPSLWNLHADWMSEEAGGGLLTKAQLGAWGAVLASIALVIAVSVTRTPGGPTPSGPHGAPPRPHDPPRPYDPAQPYDSPQAHAPAQPYGAPPLPGRPPGPAPAGPGFGGAGRGFGGGGAGAGQQAFLALALVSAVLAGWEIYLAQEYGWDLYERRITGERNLGSLLDEPSSWVVWSIVLLAAVGGLAVRNRAPDARPVAMTAAFLVLYMAVSNVSYFLKLDILDHMDEVETAGKLRFYSCFAEALAGLVVLLALAPRGPAPYAAIPAGWGPPPGPPPGTPGYDSGRPAPGGYGTPGPYGTAGGHGAPGYGQPPAGPPGYGPPPAQPPAQPPADPPPPASPPPGRW